MSVYTDNEIKMLQAFYNESVNICGACDEAENLSYMNATDLQIELGGNIQKIGGTMSSLEAKGAIIDTMESARGDRLNDFVLCPKQVGVLDVVS